jgi:hypothetical protein
LSGFSDSGIYDAIKVCGASNTERARGEFNDENSRKQANDKRGNCGYALALTW